MDFPIEYGTFSTAKLHCESPEYTEILGQGAI